MRARIYQPARNAMQSGKAHAPDGNSRYEPETRRAPDRLMGWTSSSDMRQRADADSIRWRRSPTPPRTTSRRCSTHKPAAKAKSYADNFRVDRKVPWSH